MAVLVGNLILGNFVLGFEGQPVAHSDGLWNLLGMVLVGWGSVLLGGCPLRQLILTGEGNSDSAVTVTGFVFGIASTVVNPPCAAAAAPVSTVSLYVCPGSLK